MPTHAVLKAPRDLRIEQRPARPLNPHEVRIAVRRAGVCGTDLALYTGDYPVPLPLVLGHEFVGAIAETGAQVDPTLLGRRATAEINVTCLARQQTDPCEACRRRIPRHCQRRTVLGILRCDGAFATELTAPAPNVHVIPDSISDEEAVFIEPLAAALQTFEMGPLGQGGDEGFPLDGPPWVVVLGVGRLGLLIAAVAQSLGARVAGIGRRQAKLEHAAPYCDALIRIDSPERAVAEVGRLTAGLGADYVVEATGAPDGLGLAARLVRPRGTIALKSTPGLPVHGVDLTGLVVNEVRLQGSRCGSFPKAIEFIQARKVDLRRLISDTFPLSEADKAVRAAFHKPKVVIQCAS